QSRRHDVAQRGRPIKLSGLARLVGTRFYQELMRQVSAAGQRKCRFIRRVRAEIGAKQPDFGPKPGETRLIAILFQFSVPLRVMSANSPGSPQTQDYACLGTPSYTGSSRSAAGGNSQTESATGRRTGISMQHSRSSPDGNGPVFP